MKKIVILASGKGTNFCAIADAIVDKKIKNIEIISLISNKRNAPVIKEAEKRSVRIKLIDMELYKDSQGSFQRSQYEEFLLSSLSELNPDLICLAGYMLILGKKIIHKFPGKIINIHPSLLPKYPGLKAIDKALASGDKETGCTVHYVTEGIDEGAPIIQKKVPIFEKDSIESLHKRIQSVEHEAYIEALQKITG